MPNRFERHPVLTAFALSALLPLLLFALDMGAYQVGDGITTLREKIADWRGLPPPGVPGAATSNLDFHHGLKENWSPRGATGTGYDTYTNSLGFRDERVRHVTMQPEGRRIILIGDSFTEGVGVPFAKTFAGLLSQRLAASHTEVLNAAASSYCPIIYLRKLRYWMGEQGLDADEVIVFLDMSDIQDETFYDWGPEGQVRSAVSRDWVRYYLTMHGEPYWVNWALDRTYVSKILFGMLQRASLPRDVPSRKALNSPRALWTIDPFYYESYAKAGLPLALKHMDELKAFLDARSVALKLVIYPWPDQVYRHDLPSKQEAVWKDWAAAHGVPLLDLFPDIIASGAAREVLGRYFITDDIHLNAAGHRLVADRVLDAFALATPRAAPSAGPRASPAAPVAGTRAARRP